MKKYFLMMGLACLFMVACNNAPKQEQPKDEPQTTEAAPAEEGHQCPFCAIKGEFANWDNMDDAAKATLVQKAYDLFAEMDKKKAEMEGEDKPCPKEGMPEMTKEEMDACQAKCAEMRAQWEAFDTKTLDEKKDLILGRIADMGMGQCKHEEGEGHQCQHEGEGHQCQHGEGHECQHAE